MRTGFIGFGLLISLGAIGKPSQPKDIQVTRGSGFDQESLLWADGDFIQYGVCKTEIPFDRSDCPVKKTVEKDFVISSIEATLYNKIKENVSRFEDELKKLGLDHPLAEEFITTIAELRNLVKNYEDEVRKLRKDLENVKPEIADLRGLIRNIDRIIEKLREAMQDDPENQDLEDQYRARLDQRRQLKSRLNGVLGREIEIVQNITTKNQNINELLLEISDVLLEFQSALDLADIRSERSVALNAKIEFLKEQNSSIDQTISKLKNKEIIFSDQALNAAELEIVRRTTDIIRKIKFSDTVQFSEDFSSVPSSDFWSFFSFNSGRIQFSEGRLRMDSKDGPSLNEAILKLEEVYRPGITLEFSYWNHSDERHPLPRHFIGAYDGDGVSISTDRINWYTVINADYLLGEGTIKIDLEQERKAIRSEKNPNFFFGETIYIKLQQYDDSAYHYDGMDWDNILVHSE